MIGRVYVAATAAKPLLAVAEQAGLERRQLLSVLGVSEEVVRNPDQRVAGERYSALWEYVDEKLDDPALPVRVAEAVLAEDYHLIGFAFMTSPNFREMITRFIRYTRLHTNADSWSFEEANGQAIIRLERRHDALRVRPLITECVFAKCIQVFRRVVNTPLVPIWVHFRHLASRDTRPIEDFFRVRPLFGAGEDAFAIDAHLLSTIPATANRALHAFIVSEAESRLAQERAEDSLTIQTSRAIAPLLASGEPAMTAVARQLGMSERTLRRRLAAENVTFRGLVDAVRREKACDLLRAGASVTDVAFALGFAEVSAFSRAFKRWFDVSPRAVRAQNTNVPGEGSRGLGAPSDTA